MVIYYLHYYWRNYYYGFRIIEEIDVRLENTLLERIFRLGTIHCFTGDVTDPDLRIRHIKNAKEIKDYILKQSEVERMKRKTLNTQHLDGNPGISHLAKHDSCR